jgi:nitrite reductase (NO-forming)
MDFKPSPAVLSMERHTGAFAQGSALSMDATVQAAGPGRSQGDPARHDAQDHRDRAGVKFSAWTFGDQVPGP